MCVCVCVVSVCNYTTCLACHMYTELTTGAEYGVLIEAQGGLQQGHPQPYPQPQPQPHPHPHCFIHLHWHVTVWNR